jgi:hypothetical protein
MNRQKLLLSVLLALFVLSIGYSFWRMPRQKSIPALKYTPGSVAKTNKAHTSARLDGKQVRLDLLTRATSVFSGFRRNIFQPIFQEKRKELPGRPFKIAKPVPLLPPPQSTLTPQQSPMQRDMAQFTFLGFLKKDNRKTIFLTSNNEIFLVKKGDSIAGRYEVSNITDEMLAIRSLENGGEIIIPLIENRPLQVAGQ